MSTETPVASRARLALRSGPLAGPVLVRVVGMLAARAQCPLDRLDDAVLVCDAIAAHAPSHTTDGTIVVTVSTEDNALELSIGPLREGGAEGLLAAAELPGVGNVLTRIGDEAVPGVAEDGSGETLRVRMRFVED